MRDTELNIRLTAEERAMIKAAATRDSRTVSDWVRLAALEKAREQETKA